MKQLSKYIGMVHCRYASSNTHPSKALYSLQECPDHSYFNYNQKALVLHLPFTQ